MEAAHADPRQLPQRKKKIPKWQRTMLHCRVPNLRQSPGIARLQNSLAFMRRRVTGDYEVDEFGYDRELTDRVLNAPLRPLYSKWFRVETRGLENIPDTGGALIVANHSGTVAIDSLMTSIALLDHHPARRQLRMLGANLVFQTPVVGEYARKTGSTLACAPDAERLLNKGELVGVWPEGFKGVGKPFSERYKLQRFGRGGFVSAALRTKSPIIPCAIVGAEEIYPMISNAKTLARIMGVPASRSRRRSLGWGRWVGPTSEQVDHRIRRADLHR